MFNLLSKLRASKARKIAKANADSAASQAQGRYRAALKAGDTRGQHYAAQSLQRAQTERLRLELQR